ncbi:GFA family protein [Nioella aestuarii]|uniref:GFA family protein n=1 Tax=Nioella aestuarii TaxID=1662864 RepID=UPI003D7F6061
MHEGKCACGAVTYSMKTDPMFVHCCHCSECQKQTGSAFVLNAIIETDRVEYSGPIKEMTLPTPSGKGQVISRCENCGVAVFSSYLIRQGKLLYIRVGTLNHPENCPPDVHIFTSSKLPWLKIETDIPVFEEFYVFKDVWPAKAYARLQALFGD